VLLFVFAFRFSMLREATTSDVNLSSFSPRSRVLIAELVNWVPEFKYKAHSAEVDDDCKAVPIIDLADAVHHSPVLFESELQLAGSASSDALKRESGFSLPHPPGPGSTQRCASVPSNVARPQRPPDARNDPSKLSRIARVYSRKSAHC
jgi:hypothetical protein